LNGSQETTVNQASFAIGQLVGARAVSFEHGYSELFAAALKMSSFNKKDPWRQAQLGTKIRHGLEDGMRSPRNIPGQKTPRTSRDQEQDLITAIQDINKTHAVVQLGSKTRIMKQGTCPINGWPKVDFLGQDDVKLRFNKHRYLEEGRREGLGTIWLRHPERREYDQVVFNPKGASPEHFNLWQGYPIKPAQSDKADSFLEHIRENMAARNDELFNYTLAWMADAIQNPASKPGVALVLRGDQGVGKSFFADQFGSLFGAHYTTIHNPRHVFGDFNSALFDMLLVFIDEITWLGDRKSEGILKGLITAPTIRIEKKNIDSSPVQNFSRFILASNSERIIPAGACERRFFVLNVQDHHKQDNQYFAAIAQDMDAGGREALMHFLKNYDLAGLDLRAFPKTTALQEQKYHSLELLPRVWLDWLMEGTIGTYSWQASIPTTAFCNVFRDAALKMGQRCELSETSIGQKLRKLLPCDPKSRSSLPGRPYVYTFPPLTECRKHFCVITGIPVDWPEEDAADKGKAAA
jgi:hypothetical protein